MSRRLEGLKVALWAVVGAWLAVAACRFATGLGATTNLSDAAPWGLWIAVDVLLGVALAAGGFLLAGGVHVLGLRRFRPLLRPAVLTALLGYMAVVAGLVHDLGFPWRLWHPVVFGQPESVMFEVSLCVMFYLTVLFLEFAPAALSHGRLAGAWWRRLRTLLERAAVPLVIAGAILSTLHQSSLGALFLIAPHRLHAWWFTPLLPVLFLVSAAALGLMVVVLESLASARLFRHPPRMDLLAGLGRAASPLLLGYLALRLGDLLARGALAERGSPGLALALAGELVAGALLPALLLAVPAWRRRPALLGAAALLAVGGVGLNRLNVCLLAFARPEGPSYLPSWLELAVTAGIAAASVLAFLFLVENLPVFPPEWRAGPPPPRWPRPGRTRSLAAVAGAALAFAALPPEALTGSTPLPRPVQGFGKDRAAFLEGPSEMRQALLLGQDGQPPGGSLALPVLLLDAGGDGRAIPFPHEAHLERCGGKEGCGRCHHQLWPGEDEPGTCRRCHRDLFSPADLFDHGRHVAATGGNEGCGRCHAGSGAPKNRSTAAPCRECHAGLLAAGAAFGLAPMGREGFAASWMEAAHGACRPCHEEQARNEPVRLGPRFARCQACHELIRPEGAGRGPGG